MKNSSAKVELGLVLVIAAILGTPGCNRSDKVPVTGRVTLKDGNPVVGAMVLFRSDKSGKSARGMTDPDGKYELSSLMPGDGLQPGKYYVTLKQNSAGDEVAAEIYHKKYSGPTQELIFDVVDGQANTIDMQLDAP